MTKEQFIMELEQCLQGEVSAYELSDSLTYYRQYFEDEIRNGKSEEQVVEELGSPRLIARSIIDAHGIEESASGNSDYGDNSMEVVMHRMIVPTVAMEMHILTEEISKTTIRRELCRVPVR